MNLIQFSQELQELVATHARQVVAVESGRQRASGWVWDETHVVTVEHILGGETSVVTHAGRLGAQLVGALPGLDLALLRVESAMEAAAQPKRRASEVHPGEVAIALARSSDDGVGVATGVIACRSGPWTSSRGGRAEHFLQPDLQLYPGYSGGPLLDAAGRLLGINTGGLSRYQAITLCVDTLTAAVEQMQKVRLEPAYLGVGLQTVKLPSDWGDRLQRHGGAMVVSLESSSPAARAGVLLGDILTDLDGSVVPGTADVLQQLQQLKPEQLVPSRWIRAGQAREVDITLGQRPRSGAADSD
jgi:S1-C subfamily serine protease